MLLSRPCQILYNIRMRQTLLALLALFSLCRPAAAYRYDDPLSAKLLRELSAKIALAEDAAALKVIGKAITPQVKAQMLPADVAQVRELAGKDDFVVVAKDVMFACADSNQKDMVADIL